jgi:hypothetical protein
MSNAKRLTSSMHDAKQEIYGTKNLLGLWFWLGIIFALKAVL